LSIQCISKIRSQGFRTYAENAELSFSILCKTELNYEQENVIKTTTGWFWNLEDRHIWFNIKWLYLL